MSIYIQTKILDSLAKESLGSPHLMQEFCKAICRKYNIIDGANDVYLPNNIDLCSIYKEIALTSGRSLFEKLARGPKQHSDRIPRKLKNGETTDIYGVVMAALATMRPGLGIINYDVFRGYIREVIASDLPQMHEVSRVLEKIAEISYNAGASTPVIDWEKEEGILSITDPFFAFYLRWYDR